MKTSRPLWPWLGAALCILPSGCVLGENEGVDSAYETATVDIADPSGVADGITPVAVRITGVVGASLVLQTGGEGAGFVAPDSTGTAHKTVFLADDGTGVGTASAGVVASRPGVVTVALQADPVRTTLEIEFSPVRMAAGLATPVRMAPGRVVHEVCVAVNSSAGALQAESLTVTGEFSPVRVEIRSSIPEGVDCPNEPIDAFGWRGYARFNWGTAADFAQVVMSYLGPTEDSLTTEILDLEGMAFPGYLVTPGAVESNETWTSIELSLSYPDAGPLDTAPASGVILQDIRFIPEDGPIFLGSSSGGANDPATTDSTGRVVLFFDTANLVGTFALFATPENGATVYLTDITVL